MSNPPNIKLAKCYNQAFAKYINQSINQSILNWTSESPAAGVVRSIQVYAKEVPKSGDASYIQ